MPSRNDIYSKPTIGREERLTQVADMVLRGKPTSQIAVALEVTQRQIQRDIKLLEARWQARQAEAMDTWKGRLVAMYEKLYLEAMEAWELSLKRVITTEVRTEPIAGKDGKDVAKIVGQKTTTREGRGDPRMLQAAMAALGGMVNVLGLNDPNVSQLIVQRYMAIAAEDLGMDPEDFMVQVESIAGEAWDKYGLPSAKPPKAEG